MNKVILIGNVGKDPEVKYLDSGQCLANFTLATSETFKNKAGEKVTTTEWHKVTLWGKTAEIAEKWVHKGDKLMIEGKIKTRTYDNKEGQKVYVTEIVGDSMEMLGGKPATGGQDAQGAAKEEPEYKWTRPQQAAPELAPVSGENYSDDDLPF
jgi:single-strand DNA-binding protein